MSETLEFLGRHGYALVFASVFVEQIGVPIPAPPVLLAAGALAGAGEVHLGLVGLVAVGAALLGDGLWYELGRRRGTKILQLLCRISLEPDSCVRRTEGVFERHGARSLLLSKFVPGLATVAPPLAGVFQMRRGRFLMFDGAGSLLWASTFLGLGYAFSDQLERLAARAAALGGGLLGLLLGALALYLAVKYLNRQRFLRQLRIARITAEELKRKLDAGEDVVVVDLRHSVDFEADPEWIPGARRMDVARLEETHEGIPRDREVVLYCT